MVKNNIIFVLACFLIAISCSTKNPLTDINKELKEKKINFGIETTKANLLNHFPKKIKNMDVHFEISPPTVPPTFNCESQYGSVFLTVKRSDYKEELSRLFKKNITYKTPYKENNIIINLSELKKEIFPIQKCNKWYSKKLPMPYFENFDVGLGEHELKKEVEGITYFNDTYTIPKDLMVYVISSESENLWKENCNEIRPEQLKEWQHGYSKGFAISKEQNILIYWSLLW